ncbi:Octicosapeptide/Phox/Bem1p family protein [Rhynchospora pubera]|uniref:Octicosapeptide/Phox/Bem1p family protein n=1 Tax=Rhynchospora pubera TaxID=906938 RepID=A0AAV8FNL5_9POAL|nr:Octicosapeptide/Phox/Bem1p family protein [Rhynchospora pubera]
MSMVGASSSSSSSCASFSSFDDVSDKPFGNNSNCVKFLCSYGGKILPRYPDGKLRYVGGDTRVLSVDRSLPFIEIEAKMKEMCGLDTVSVRCQIPTEDLDALVSVTSDEDLANLLEEYDAASRDQARLLKIRTFLMPKTPSPPSTPPLSATARITGKMPIQQHIYAARAQPPANLRCVHQVQAVNPAMVSRQAGYGNYQYQQQQFSRHHHHQHHAGHSEPRPHQYLVHHAKLWQ